MEVRVKSGAGEPTGTVSLETGIAVTILWQAEGGVKRERYGAGDQAIPETTSRAGWSVSRVRPEPSAFIT